MKKLIILFAIVFIVFAFMFVADDASAENYLKKTLRKHRERRDRVIDIMRDLKPTVVMVRGTRYDTYPYQSAYAQAYANGRIHGWGFEHYTGHTQAHPHLWNLRVSYPSTWRYEHRTYECRVYITVANRAFCVTHNSYTCNVLGNYPAYSRYVDPARCVEGTYALTGTVACMAHREHCKVYPWPGTRRSSTRHHHHDYDDDEEKYEEYDRTRRSERRSSNTYAPNLLLVPILMDRGCPEGYSPTGEAEVDSKNRLCHICARDPADTRE